MACSASPPSRACGTCKAWSPNERSSPTSRYCHRRSLMFPWSVKWLQIIETFIKVGERGGGISAVIVCFTAQLPGPHLKAEEFNERSKSRLISESSSVQNHSSDMN